MAFITINEKLCKGCGLCVRACPKDVIELSKTKTNLSGYFVAVAEHMEKCIGCSSCAIMCPDCVIEVDR